MRSTVITSLAISAALLIGCSGNSSSTSARNTKLSNAKDKIKDAVDSTTKAAEAKRDEYAREMSKSLDELSVKMEALKVRAAKAEGQAKKDLEKKLEETKVKHETAAKKLDELKTAGAEGWEKVKAGVGGAFDDLKKAIE